MNPEEKLLWLQQERDRLVERLEIARHLEAQSQLEAQQLPTGPHQPAPDRPIPHESPRVLEDKLVSCDGLIREAEAEVADFRLERVKQLANLERGVEHESDQTPVPMVVKSGELPHHDFVVSPAQAGPEVAATIIGAFVVQEAMERVVDAADKVREVFELAKKASAQVIDTTLAAAFPEATKKRDETVDRQAQEHLQLERDIENHKATFIRDHPDASTEQRALLEAQALVAREAEKQRHAAELARMIEAQRDPQTRS